MRHSTPYHRRMLTVAAIVMMISSAMISFFLVQENDHHINDLKRNEEKTEQAIRTLWNNTDYAMRSADSAVIVSLLANDDSPESQAVKHYYFARAGAAPSGMALTDLLKAADEKQKRAVNAINDQYIAQLDMENEIMAREARNKRYADFAFLLQLISLVLVILKHEMPGV